ncbi:hypothetical protein BDV96DRAFT_36279 [Lophiotrema nucula]|uniref:Uncharacterized protein n=1 Tax=Lophiotrema nucula TaxID=690887 RepID=A0A6A5ZCC6_9PLEO|nr:hypothetical protein BDV96DRAFT_36279 [Lophiotrema nucula]
MCRIKETPLKCGCTSDELLDAGPCIHAVRYNPKLLDDPPGTVPEYCPNGFEIVHPGPGFKVKDLCKFDHEFNRRLYRTEVQAMKDKKLIAFNYFRNRVLEIRKRLEDRATELPLPDFGHNTFADLDLDSETHIEFAKKMLEIHRLTCYVFPKAKEANYSFGKAIIASGKLFLSFTARDFQPGYLAGVKRFMAPVEEWVKNVLEPLEEGMLEAEDEMKRLVKEAEAMMERYRECSLGSEEMDLSE